MTQLEDRVENTDKWFRFTFIGTSLVLILLAILTFVNVARISSNLQTQVEDHRHQTEDTIKSIKEENQKLIAENRASHDEQIRFIKCILLIAREDRTQAVIENCIEQAQIEAENEGGSSTAPTNNTPNANPPQSNNSQNQSNNSPNQPSEQQPAAQNRTEPAPSEQEEQSEPDQPGPIDNIMRVIEGLNPL